jgi:hypothetical protein
MQPWWEGELIQPLAPMAMVKKRQSTDDRRHKMSLVLEARPRIHHKSE